MNLSRLLLLRSWLGQKLVDDSLSLTATTLCIEDAFSTRLSMAYHRLLPVGGHRGSDTTCRKLTHFYHWEDMKGDCDEFVRRCEVYNPRMTATLPHVRSHSLTELPHPFHTIYVDHKTMPRSLNTAFHYIIVV
eukprot:1780319-Pleurochrysis_carterae.AAC.2